MGSYTLFGSKAAGIGANLGGAGPFVLGGGGGGGGSLPPLPPFIGGGGGGWRPPHLAETGMEGGGGIKLVGGGAIIGGGGGSTGGATGAGTGGAFTCGLGLIYGAASAPVVCLGTIFFSGSFLGESFIVAGASVFLVTSLAIAASLLMSPI